MRNKTFFFGSKAFICIINISCVRVYGERKELKKKKEKLKQDKRTDTHELSNKSRRKENNNWTHDVTSDIHVRFWITICLLVLILILR